MKVDNICKHIEIFRDDKGWYYKIFFNLIKIRFDSYNTKVFNSMYHLQTETKNITEAENPHELQLTVVFNVCDLQFFFFRFVNYYQITKMSPFYKSWYYCNIFDMEKSRVNNYFINTGIDDLTNESYNVPIRFGWLFRFKLTGKLRNTFNSSIYIRI